SLGDQVEQLEAVVGEAREPVLGDRARRGRAAADRCSADREPAALGHQVVEAVELPRVPGLDERPDDRLVRLRLHRAAPFVASRWSDAARARGVREPSARVLHPSSVLTDAELVTMARAGEADALAALLERHRAGLYGAALAVLRDRDAAQDAVQETSLVAL